MIYLNHAGTSWPKPAPVRQAVAEMLGGSTSAWGAAFEHAHARVARAFGIGDPTRLLLTPGCTSALAVGIADHPWQEGDRLVVSGLEHHALFRPATLLAERGVEVVVVDRGRDAPLDLEALARALSQGRVRLVAMTAACNVTGELLPTEEIIALAHEHGALCLLDAAQPAGWLPIDVGALGVDLLAFAGHKALQAPWGIGGLYVASHVAMTSPEAACELPRDGGAAGCATMPGYCDVGSVDRAALAGLAAALDWLERPAQGERLAAGRDRIARMAEVLTERAGVHRVGVREPTRRLPTLAFTVEGRASAEVAADFAARGILVASGLQCAPQAHEALGTAPEGAVRVSVGPQTTDDDVDRVLEAIASLPS